jgi:3-dehydroquinate synthetase
MGNDGFSPEFKSKLVFAEKLTPSKGPDLFRPEKSLLVFDRRLLKVSREFSLWSRRFPFQYAVDSGEGLKDLRSFPAHVAKLGRQAEGLSPRDMTVVAVGGGSVGDFAGFFASTYKRGVDLMHVPSTWLAAIDSSHGGKTALNVSGAKNQIGTFYPASHVVLVRSLLETQPAIRVAEAMGELGKIALLDGGSWVKELENTSLEGASVLWEFLKHAIRAKMKVVLRDPYEKSGERQILNLGHTMGHVFEAAYGVAHGQAVAQGLFFAIEFSEHVGLLREKTTERAMRLLSERLGLYPQRPRRKLSAAEFYELLLKDKKRAGVDQVTFVFIRGFGKPVRAVVNAVDLLSEAGRQGWVEDR